MDDQTIVLKPMILGVPHFKTPPIWVCLKMGKTDVNFGQWWFTNGNYGYPFFGDNHNILSIWDRWKRWFLHSSLFAAATLRLWMGLASSVPLTAEQSIGDQEKPKLAMNKTSWLIGYYRNLFYLIYWGWWYPIVGKTYQPTSIHTNEMGYVTCFVLFL